MDLHCQLEHGEEIFVIENGHLHCRNGNKNLNDTVMS